MYSVFLPEKKLSFFFENVISFYKFNKKTSFFPFKRKAQSQNFFKKSEKILESSFNDNERYFGFAS